MEEKRILWVDWLKFLGIFGIVGIHITSSLLSSNILFTSQWYQGVVAGSILRFGIILFIMASGFLVLRKNPSIADIPRRFKRVLVPFIFWLIVYAVIKVVFRQELGPSWNFMDLCGFIYNGFLDPTLISVQFWYVYMILGLYILAPIIGRWIHNAPIREVDVYVWLWIIINMLNFFNVDSLLFSYFEYFLGAVGYFVLGYYLTIKDDDLFRSRRFGAMLFLVGSAITIIGTIGLSLITHDQSLFFIRLGDLTPGACLQGIGVFIIVFNTDFRRVGSNINKVVVKISRMSYGIYLANILVINFLELFGLIYLGGFTFFNIIFYTFIVILLSAMFIDFMDMVPVLRFFSGK